MRIVLLIITALIFASGMVMIFSASSAEILDHNLDNSAYNILIRQLIYAFFGLIAAFLIWKMGYLQVLQAAPFFLTIFTILLILTFVPGVGREVNGSKRWITLFGISLQPSEFVKFILPAFFIHQIMQCKKVLFLDFFKIIMQMSVPIVLILLEPNNGTVAVITLTLIVLFFLTRIPLKYWALPILVFALVGTGFAYNLPYVNARLKVYLNPGSDILGRGHQPHQAKVAAGSGGFLGKGIGESWQKLSFLPEAQNDYIAAIFAEESGFLGIMLLIFLYMALACLGFYIAAKSGSLEGFYLAAIITFLISLQAFLNLAVVSGLAPATGLNLPFFSQGGSSLVANLIGIGLIQSVGQEK